MSMSIRVSPVVSGNPSPGLPMPQPDSVPQEVEVVQQQVPLVPKELELGIVVGRRFLLADQFESALEVEESYERLKDRGYWLPLKKELEKLRHGG